MVKKSGRRGRRPLQYTRAKLKSTHSNQNNHSRGVDSKVFAVSEDSFGLSLTSELDVLCAENVNLRTCGASAKSN